jgi:hypothetical protein
MPSLLSACWRGPRAMLCLARTQCCAWHARNVALFSILTPSPPSTSLCTCLVPHPPGHSKKPRIMKLKLGGLGAHTPPPADAAGPYSGQKSVMRNRSRSKSFDSITRGLVVRSQRSKHAKEAANPATPTAAAPITTVQGPSTPNQLTFGRGPPLITSAASRAPPLSGGRIRSSTTSSAYSMCTCPLFFLFSVSSTLRSRECSVLLFRFFYHAVCVCVCMCVWSGLVW